MAKIGGEGHSRKKDFLESGEPNHYLNLDGEKPIIDAITELDKVQSGLRFTHQEELESKQGKRKTWIDRAKTSKKATANKDLNI